MIEFLQKLIAKQWGGTLYMVTPGGQKPKFWPKMTTNTGIMQITSQFGPFDNAKWPQNTSRTKIDSIFFKIKHQTLRGNPIYGHPGGEIPKCLPKITPNTGIMK